MRWLLKNFEIISGLSVNFDKSVAYGVNVGRDEIGEIVSEWGDSSLIPYLGIKVG